MLRLLINMLLCICLVAGVVVLFGAFQLHQAQQQAQPEPQTMTLKQLVESGPGDNAHVELMDVCFGNPIIEENGAQWRSVWLPLYVTKPVANRAQPPTVVMHVSQIRDQAGLDEFLKRESLTAVVSDRMPALTPWKLKLPAQFAKDYPTKEPVKTTLLAEPEVRFMNWTWGPEVVFDGVTLHLAWALGGVLAFVGLAGLLWIGKIEAVAERAAAPRVDSKAKAALAEETAISSHAFNTAEFASRGFKIWLYCGILIGVCFALMVAGFSLLTKNPSGAFTIVGVTSGLILINAFLIRSHTVYRTRGVAAIEICPSGLRWLKATDQPAQTAVWAEIKGVELNHLSPYPWRHLLTITLRSGEVLQLAAFSLTNYAAFAKLLSASHKQQSAASFSVLPFAPPGVGYQSLSTARRAK
jgi:hypothetical protein